MGVKVIHVGKIVFSTNGARFMLSDTTSNFIPTPIHFILYSVMSSFFHPPIRSHHNLCTSVYITPPSEITSLVHRCKYIKIYFQPLDLQEPSQVKPFFSILLHIVCNNLAHLHSMAYSLAFSNLLVIVSNYLRLPGRLLVPEEQE